MTRFPLLPLVALLALASCGDAESETASTATLTEVQRAAAIAEGVRMAPTQTDSVLNAHGVTADELEQMLYRIAADSVQTAEYRRLTGR